MNCPNDETLRLWLDGTLAAHEVQAWSTHLGHCPRCQSSLARLSDDDELRAWRDQHSRDAPSAADEANCAALVDRALAVLRDASSHEGRAPLDPSPSPVDLGRLGGYRIEAELGRGGMGVVYRAFDERLRRVVAVKLLHPHLSDAAGRARFVREAQAAARVQHPHVVAVHHAEQLDARRALLVMEWIDGPSLREHLKACQTLEPRAAAEWIAQAADGLAAAHAAQLVHRDIKPANILLAPSLARSETSAQASSVRVAKLTDFGLARTADVGEPSAASASATTLGGLWGGTPAYMSPQQAAHPETPAPSDDVYSLGVTLYECLTGSVPFRGAPHAVLRQIVADEPPSPRTLNDSIPRDLEVICLKAMAKEPAQRYSSAAELAADLRRWLCGEPITARPASRVERLWRWSRRNPKVASLSAAVVGLLALIAVGSTIAALRLAAAHTALQEKSDAVLAASERERAQASRAVAQSQVALDSLNELIFRLQADLRDEPATLRTRQRLLETALAGLSRVTRDAPEGVATDHSFAVAHLRMGDLLWLGGKPDDARREYREAADIATNAWKKSPADRHVRRDLALAEEMIGYLDQQAQRFDDCRRRYDAALMHRVELWRQTPDDPALLRELYMSHNRLGDLASLLNRHDEALTRYTEALELLDRLAKFVDGQAPDLLEQRAKTQRRVGWALVGLERHDDAEARYRESLRTAQALVDRQPENVSAVREVLLTRTSLGNLLQSRERLEEAADEHRQASDGLRTLARAEPNHAELQWDLALSLQSLGAVLRALDRCDQSLDVQEEVLEVLEALTNDYPQVMKYRQSHFAAAYAAAELQLRAGRYGEAQANYQRTLDSIEQLRRLAGSLDPLAAWMESLVRRLHVACPALIDPRLTLDQVPEDSRPLVRLVRAYEAARAGRYDESFPAAQQLLSNLPSHPLDRAMFLQSLARVAAVAASRTEAARPADAQAARTWARARLQESHALAPGLAVAITLEPDLRDVR
ncbi:MAG: serine/threonine-protein kinase [Pirellulales bacterium]